MILWGYIQSSNVGVDFGRSSYGFVHNKHLTSYSCYDKDVNRKIWSDLSADNFSDLLCIIKLDQNKIVDYCKLNMI